MKPTDEIVLNALDLTIDSVSLNGDKKLTPKEVALSTEDETATFRFESPLPPGSYGLGIAFKGEINDKMKGLYR